MEVIEEIIKDIWKVLLGALGFSWKFLNLFLWALAGVLILPCVFVAGNIYPAWEKWAQSLKK